MRSQIVDVEQLLRNHALHSKVRGPVEGTSFSRRITTALAALAALVCTAAVMTPNRVDANNVNPASVSGMSEKPNVNASERTADWQTTAHQIAAISAPSGT